MHSEKERALAILEKYGSEPISWQTLESPFQYWFCDEGFVGYVDTGGAWVAAGSPVAPVAKTNELARRFTEVAREHRRRAVFFGAEKSLGGKSLCVGIRPYWNPQEWTTEGPARASLRYQLRRATRNGVSVRRIAPENIEALRAKIERVVRDWEARHAIAPMGFIVSLELYVFPERHIYFVAECGDEVVGLLSAVPVFGRQGWFVEDLIRTATAPNGTNDLLVNTFFELVKSQGARYVTLGLVPLGGPIGLPLRAARNLLQPLFHFKGLEHFKEKLLPTGKEPRFILATKGVSRFRAIIDVLSAFSNVGLVRFAVNSFFRGPLVALEGLTWALVFWLTALILAPTAPWFPSSAIHEAWCLFDVGLAVGLVSLCRRYRVRLNLLLASLVSADAVLTLYEAFTYNWPRSRGFWDNFFVTIACAGPFIGATVLWSAWRRCRRLTID